MTRKPTRKPKFTDAERARLASITEQLQNPESSLSEQAKALLRRESLEIHKSEESREQLRIEQKAAAKKNRAEAKAKAAKQISDYPAKPTLEECDGDAGVYRKELELWQLGLDEQKAQKILDSPKYSLASRDTANRTLRKCARNDAMKFIQIISERTVRVDALERLCRDFSERMRQRDSGRAFLCRAGTISRLRKTPSEGARIWSRVSFVAEHLQIHGLSRR